ncbi:hypothetical protein M436DRAFT_71206 [Aureobasidium namibiae CBS 147.97]|uniref:Cryptic loci regulator 2 N-terminal domain-containing protein n=1 Tax=Aureobasidium namibiae CBS 147.97 TaxID=1043004 RepID=A0A074WNJ8_9PEZI|nr:uncharacterized protein M436DRAFT_71206 [Aureobasidium namibiae CBS 147.97]KEQ74680.1 hypothetical protein M436DRAFT_71206 [Aureobasidium namibiae CBS 147.97]
MPHALFRKQHLDVRELDLSTIVYSSNDPEHLPNPKLNYTPVPDDEALELLTEAFNRHPDKSAMMAELNCNRVKFIGGLPQGMTCFAAPTKEGRSPDRYIYGHGNSSRRGFDTDKLFRSFREFVPHCYWIIVERNVAWNRPRFCYCKYCQLPFPQ